MEMDHNMFDYSLDLIIPLKKFLLEMGLNFDSGNENDVKLEGILRECPQSVKPNKKIGCVTKIIRKMQK